MNRLKEDLIEAGKFGREPQRRVECYAELDPENGVSRPEGTSMNRQIRDFAVARMKAAGLSVKIDKFGNIFGRIPGIRADCGDIMCGSHLDSVLNGGQFDGALGVFAAIEAVRRMQADGFQNGRAVEVVAFTGEEGSAFGQGLLGSSALCGKLSQSEALSVTNAENKSLAQVLKQTGYNGDFERELDNVDYFVEMHIEQGPVLDRAQIPLGIVENITGVTWITAIIKGMANHAGTTPMNMRQDALVAAAEVVSFVRRRADAIAAKYGSPTVGTVGRLEVFPNGINVIPGKVRLGIDIRDVRNKIMQRLMDDTVEMLKGLESIHGVAVEVQIPPVHDPVPLSPELVQTIEAAAQKAGIPYLKMNSGAGHDAQIMAGRVKTGMIFVPSKDGVSHSPLEWTAWEDIEKGVSVLTQTLKDLSGTGRIDSL